MVTTMKGVTFAPTHEKIMEVRHKDGLDFT